MKAISASIVILAGAILMAAYGLTDSGDHRDLGMIAGLGFFLMLLGVIAWLSVLLSKDGG